MSEFNKLVNRNYHAVVKRGQINPDTTNAEFINKMVEELIEVQVAHDCKVPKEKLVGEVVNLMSVCTCFLEHHGLDVENEYKEKATVKNEWRAENE